ncbi:MAG TPA: efflux RND transporter periplasmic adaptor subunit [Gammaproteobacteria bacterium]|nr:efflux RND transporter periplasmic adaptor subunit [Gammaproteobacteria bacterium]
MVALALALLAGGGLLWYRAHFNRPLTYTTAPVSRGAVAPYVIASGTVNPVTTVQVGTYVSGVIQELYCDFNTLVRKDQLCAKIDPRPYEMLVDEDAAALATSRAQLSKDQANLDFATSVLERDKELLKSGFISQETFDTADSAFRQARSQIALDQAAIKQREAELNAAKVNLGYTNIVSPVDGTVVSRNVTQGQTVAASFQTPTLFVIATDLTKMEVDTNVSESDIGSVRLGSEASFTVEAYPGRTFQGRVVQVRQSPQSVQNVVTYDVVSEAPNPDLLLKPGMTAAVRIVSVRHDNALRVPTQALRYSPASRSLERPTEPRVWVLRDGNPVEVPVTIGLTDDSNAEITAGAVDIGDPVILSEHVAQTSRPASLPSQSIPRAPRL